MQAKKRYLLLVFLCCAFLAYCYFGVYRLKAKTIYERDNDHFRTFVDTNGLQGLTGNIGGARLRGKITSGSAELCRMETCFDFTRCIGSFKVYIYPPLDNIVSSNSYQKLLKVISESRYYTANPKEACLFVLGIDTLDRDPLSSDYVKRLQSRIHQLPEWNNGLNHVIFNLYSGTWPNYTEQNLDFDYGLAILAKASMSQSHLRSGFDISIPLFQKGHLEKGGGFEVTPSNVYPLQKRYLLSFKGKRYVHGIGSDTRNSLHHLHNDQDIVIVTTCKHGKSWKDMQDERCDQDNKDYSKYDYITLLYNSTFCLVPRGRRLGSYRFLEALQAGCIPVILSNGWALPFADVIDWNQAVIWADERLLLQVPALIRSLTPDRILKLRQKCQILYERYFSSIEKIVYTTFEIIRERLPEQAVRDGTVWNNFPGALLTLPSFSDIMHNFPLSLVVDNTFTAVIYCHLGLAPLSSSPLYRLLLNVLKSQFVSAILIVWASERRIPNRTRWPVSNFNISFNIIQTSSDTSISKRFQPWPQVKTSAILSLDEDTVLTADEIDFAFVVWQKFPDRIVGYPARSHYWDDSKSTWGYTSKWTNDYSIVLTGAAFYHSYYNVLYTEWLSPLLHKTVEQSHNCEDILMNFLVSHIIRRPPIKVTQRKQYKEQPVSGIRSPWNDPDHFVQRQTCLNTFAAVFGYMPLLRSNLRLDPVLFKDPVSNKRKKYRKIELIGN